MALQTYREKCLTAVLLSMRRGMLEEIHLRRSVRRWRWRRGVLHRDEFEFLTDRRAQGLWSERVCWCGRWTVWVRRCLEFKIGEFIFIAVEITEFVPCVEHGFVFLRQFSGTSIVCFSSCHNSWNKIPIKVKFDVALEIKIDVTIEAAHRTCSRRDLRQITCCLQVVIVNSFRFRPWRRRWWERRRFERRNRWRF